MIRTVNHGWQKKKYILTATEMIISVRHRTSSIVLNTDNILHLVRHIGESADSLTSYSLATITANEDNNNNLLVYGVGAASNHFANERTHLMWIFFSVFMAGATHSL